MKQLYIFFLNKSWELILLYYYIFWIFSLLAKVNTLNIIIIWFKLGHRYNNILDYKEEE